MDIHASRTENGEYLLEMDFVTIELPSDAVGALRDIIHKRLDQSNSMERQALEKKITAYRALANKMIQVEDRIIQQIAIEISPEQLVTLAKLAPGEELYEKILQNLSRQNKRQFEEDFATMTKITEHQACVNMEKIVPLIKRVAQQQKQAQS